MCFECGSNWFNLSLINTDTNIFNGIKTGFETDIIKPFEKDIINIDTNIFNNIKTGFEDTIIKGFEDNIIKPATDIVNNFQFPVLGGNKQPTKPPIRNTTSNNDNYIYIGAALIAAFIILKL